MAQEIETTLGKLAAGTPALQSLLAKPLPAVTAFRLARLGRDIEAELGAYEAARRSLCERLGTLSEDGTLYQFESRARADEFSRELNSLLTTQVTLHHEPLLLTALGEIEIAPAELMALDWLVV